MLPELTHLQFYVLHLLSPEGGHVGSNVRERLFPTHRLSYPAFYQLMARLDKAGWVWTIYRQRVPNHPGTRECVYALTDTGRAKLAEVRAFYKEFL